MLTRTDESPPYQQDRAVEEPRSPRDDVQNVAGADADPGGNYDAARIDDPDINLHGSER